MRRWSDWAFYGGIASLATVVVINFRWPEFERLWWALLITGVVLVILSALPWLRDLRVALTGRTARHGLYAAITILLLLSVVGFVEALSFIHNKAFDLTENRRYSLSPQSIQLVRGLKTDVKALGFFRPDQPGKRVAEGLLAQYARYSNGRFKWETVDLDLGPKLALRYGVESYGTVVLDANGKHEKILDPDEERLTNALVKVTRAGKRVVYVVQGHGEPDLANSERFGFSVAKQAMERSNYEVKPLVLARETKVPDDASLVVEAGPRIELFPPEVEALGAYLARGGKLLAMLNSPLVQRVQDGALRKLLGTYGVEIADDVVIEYSPLAQLSGLGPMVPIVQDYDAHAITRDFGGVMTVFPLARSLSQAKQGPQGVAFTALARTSTQSWSETNRQEIESGRVKLDPDDKKGPLVVAAVATKDKARLVIYGTAALATNEFFGAVGNRDLFLNSVSWLADEEEQIAIRPRDSRVAPIFLTQNQGRLVDLLSIVALPGLTLVAGILVVIRRRAAK